MPIIDTHLHLIYPDRFDYPWLVNQPGINRPFPFEAYWAEAQALGIEKVLHMEVDVAEGDIEAESRFVTGLSPIIVGAIAACRPEHEDFPAQLERLAAIKGVRGLRRVLHVAPDDIGQSALFQDNIRRLARHGLSFDLCLRADQLRIGRQIAAAAPEVQFILDHCGNPDIANDGLDFWRGELAKIAELPNVAAKISGIIVNAAPGWTSETLRPYIEWVIETFGWDRVVWGSDHPVVTLNGTLSQWVETTRTVIAGASPEEQAKLWRDNAARIYRLS